MFEGVDDITTCVASSRHPEAPGAVGEVAGAVLERVEPHPELLVVLAGRSLASSLQAMTIALRSLLAPELMIGAAVTDAFTGPGPPDSLVVLTVSGPSIAPVGRSSDGRSDDAVDETGGSADVGRSATGLIIAEGGHELQADEVRAVTLADPPTEALNALVIDDQPVAAGLAGVVGFDVFDGMARMHVIDGSSEAAVNDALSAEVAGVTDGSDDRSVLLLAEPQVDLGRNPSLGLLYDCWPDSLAAATVPWVAPPSGRRGIQHGHLAVALSFGAFSKIW